MRGFLAFLMVAAIAPASPAANHSNPAPDNCAERAVGAAPCPVSPKVRKEAKSSYDDGLKLQKENQLDEALVHFEKAAQLVPRDVQYLTAREMVRQQLAFEHVQRGNQALASANEAVALAEFRAALRLDPQNPYARQRMQDAMGTQVPRARETPRLVEAAGEIRLSPRDIRHSFHYRGDSRGLLTQIASTYAITAIFDDSVSSRRVRFDVDDIDFFAAMRLAGTVTKTFWTPLEQKQILVAAESTENHRLFDRFGLRTFYIPGTSTPQELTDVTNLLRTVFELKFVQPEPQAGTITIRGPQTTLEAASLFLEGMDSRGPEVLLEVQVFQVSSQVTRNFGVQIPNQLTLYQIPTAALAALAGLGGQNIQDLINQLIANGGINQSTSQAISALIAQLQGQQNSIFNTPLVTFGNGATLFGVGYGKSLTATLQLNESDVRSLQKVTLHASQGKDATFNLGERFPVINASFAPIFNSSAISQSIQGGSFIAPIPSINYEDLGIKVKAKPAVHGNTDVSLDLNIELKALTGVSVNGVPVISNRSYQGSINLKNGEGAAVAGEISHTEQRSLSGIPGFGNVPGLSDIMTSNSVENDRSELIIVITPRVLSMPESNPDNEIWMSTSK